MFDPAALGTLLIGLDSIRVEADEGRNRRSPSRGRPRPRGASVRLTAARQLRRLADALERPAQRQPAT